MNAPSIAEIGGGPAALTVILLLSLGGLR